MSLKKTRKTVEQMSWDQKKDGMDIEIEKQKKNGKRIG